MIDKPSLSNKVFTENPLLDEIVYNARQLATGVILKDSDKANHFETAESAKMGDFLLGSVNRTMNFSNFIYDEDFLVNEMGYNTVDAFIYANDNSLLLKNKTKEEIKKIIDKASDLFIKNYEEQNSYYRMLQGLPTPKYNKTAVVPVWEGLYIKKFDPNDLDDSNPVSLDDITPYNMEGYILIHELDFSTQNMLFDNGTCESIINASEWLESYDIPKEDVMYLMHIGGRAVDSYTARSAEKFALMYCPKCDSEEVRTRFRDLFEANRIYLLYTNYSEAYKYRSDYYDNFMMIFLIIQTIIDMVVELPEYIIRRDIFDTRTCKYMFEANGVKYFKDIPLKYQVSLVKNLNKLIKFKSTDKCIVDIISIFGAESIEVFRYYILRDRRVNNPKKLDYFDNTKKETDTLYGERTVEDEDKNYDIRFIKVPLLGNYDEEIRTDSKIYSYDSMIDGDATWNGDRDYKNVLHDIKNLDFTVLRSKFYSIEAVIDIAKRNFTLAYFTNMLLYNNIDKSRLRLPLPNVSTNGKFELVDVILALYSISYIYYGVEDTIIDSRVKAANILGFNLEADLAKISSWLEERKQHLGINKEFKVDFSVPENGRIMTYKELENLYFKNKNCYDHIISVLNDPPSKEIYDIYKQLYKSLMIMNANMENFVVSETITCGEIPTIAQYKEKGYKSKFIELPPDIRKEEHMFDYTNTADYDRDYKWAVDSIDEKDLCFVIRDDFDTSHEYDLYIKENGALQNIGKAKMAYTYREYLRSKPESMRLFSFINKIVQIPNIEDRKQACVNAIQSITSYMKDYITFVDLDTVFSGLPSISLDFIKRYVEEVIDFFKSFKIFTHGSSITYAVTDKFNNYVHLIDHALLKYLFDKSEIIKIEDAINNMKVNLTSKERFEMIDKVWFDIYSFIEKNFSDYYNSDQYKESGVRIREFIERYDTLYVESREFIDHHINDLEIDAVDAIMNTIVDITKLSKLEYREDTKFKFDGQFDDHYNYWISEVTSIIASKYMEDRVKYQDDCIRSSTFDTYTIYNIPEFMKHSTDFSVESRLSMSDGYYSIITQDYPPHKFDQ